MADARSARRVPRSWSPSRLLKGFRRSGELWNRNGFLQGALTAYDKNGIPGTAELLRALGEAFDWLRFNVLLAADPHQSGAEHCYVTRRGVEVAESPDGLALIRAADRLNVDLHPRIARRVRAQISAKFAAGGSSIFAASRQLAWVHHRQQVHGSPVIPLLGTTSVAHLRSNVAAADLRLTDDELRLLHS